MRTHWIKIIIDIVMAVILFTLFSIASTGLSFHEIVGLVIFGVVIIHLALNWRWIVSFTKRLFSKTTPTKIRIGYGLNVLLLISFVLITLSGIMMSKVVFKDVFTESDNAKTVHYFFSALSLILVGLHLGLHWAFLKAMFKRIIKLPPQFNKVLGGLMVLVIFAFGAYSLTTSSLIPWLVSPVMTIETAKETYTAGLGGGQGRHNKGIESDEETEILTEGSGRGYRGGLGVSFNPINTATIIAEFGSIAILIAIITAGTEAMMVKRRKIKSIT